MTLGSFWDHINFKGRLQSYGMHMYCCVALACAVLFAQLATVLADPEAIRLSFALIQSQTSISAYGEESNVRNRTMHPSTTTLSTPLPISEQNAFQSTRLVPIDAKCCDVLEKIIRTDLNVQNLRISSFCV